MNDQQAQFVREFVLTGNASQSAIKAGYSKKTSRAIGYNLKKKLAKEIENATRLAIQDAVPGALAQITDLSQHANTESIKFQAACAILNYAGLKAVEKTQTTVVEKSIDELRSELEQLNSLDSPREPSDEPKGPLN